MSEETTHVLADLVIQILDDDKAEHIVQIDLTQKSSIADTMIIASGRSGRHISAMADHVSKSLKTNGFGSPRTEGLENADWVLLDAGDAIIHLFKPEVRAFYDLEKMWSMTLPESARIDA